nr:immunoglobulin heavy chain junction region [Mus musculus]MBK4197909.1 immunoglobulin heavy chain junction region [Mus musculus]MBK4197910.1 immunoglobulin heavy chain junction region [Mus musculus]
CARSQLTGTFAYW